MPFETRCHSIANRHSHTKADFPLWEAVSLGVFGWIPSTIGLHVPSTASARWAGPASGERLVPRQVQPGRVEPAGGRNRSPHVQGERQTLPDGSFQLMQSVTPDAPKTQTWVMRRVDAHRYTATPDRCLGTGRGRGGWRPIPPELRDGVAGWWADAAMYVIAARWALGRERGDHEPPRRGRGPALGTNHAGGWSASRVIVARPVR
jgi:hypothetical protein